LPEQQPTTTNNNNNKMTEQPYSQPSSHIEDDEDMLEMQHHGFGILDIEFIVCFTAFCILLLILYHKLRPQHVNPFSVMLPHQEWMLEYSSRIIEAMQAAVAVAAILLFEAMIVSWHWVHVARIFIDAFFAVDILMVWIVWYQSTHAEPLFRRMKPIEARFRTILRLPPQSAARIAALDEVEKTHMPASEGLWITFHHLVTFIGIHGFVSIVENALLRVYMYGEIPILLIHAGWLHDHSRPRPPGVDQPIEAGVAVAGGDPRLLPPSRTGRMLLRCDRVADRYPGWIQTTWQGLRRSSHAELKMLRYKATAILYLGCRMTSFTFFAATQVVQNLMWTTHPFICLPLLMCFGLVYVVNWNDCKKLFRRPYPEIHAKMQAAQETITFVLTTFMSQIAIRVREFRPAPAGAGRE